MYNRYIPQSDGSYRRNRMQDIPQQNRPSQHHPHPKPEAKYEVPLPPPCALEKRETVYSRKETGVPAFLRQLLPKD